MLDLNVFQITQVIIPELIVMGIEGIMVMIYVSLLIQDRHQPTCSPVKELVVVNHSDIFVIAHFADLLCPCNENVGHFPHHDVTFVNARHVRNFER